MADLATLIRSMQEEITRKESEILKLKQELLEARRILLGSEFSPVAQVISPSAVTGNSTEWAADVLQRARKPLHINAIISDIERFFGVSVRYSTIVGNIARLVKKGKIFERVGPNIYGLLAWNDEREADQLFGEELKREMEGPERRERETS